MADTSPGKVQAMCAYFSQKEDPAVVPLQSNCKVGASKMWKRSLSSSSQDSIQEKLNSGSSNTLPGLINSSTNNKSRIISSGIAQRTPLSQIASNSVLTSNKKTVSMESFSQNSEEKTSPNSLKPTIGPKPRLSQRMPSPSPTNSEATVEKNKSDDRSRISRSSTANSKNETNVSKQIGQALRNFALYDHHKFSSSQRTLLSNASIKQDKEESTFVKHNSDSFLTSSIQNSGETDLPKKNFSSSNLSKLKCSNMLNSENYICKSVPSIKRKALPSKEKLGSPPLKPSKPSHMQFIPYLDSQSPPHNQPLRSSSPRSSMVTNTPIPPRPTKPAPMPPTSSPKSICRSQAPLPSEPCLTENSHKNVEEICEELYEDTIVREDNTRPVSMIPEYTEEEELGSISGKCTDDNELYADTEGLMSLLSINSQPLKPRNPPPPPPSSSASMKSYNNMTIEELYQDAVSAFQEEHYEVMPTDRPEEPGSPLYSNNKKEYEKIKREEEKKIRKELKEKEKREREMEKIRKKFGLTGDEVPIDQGLVKSDCRGGRHDLPVRKGETVIILRMENNPSGKWLAKNELGQLGYVELTNIEVMAVRKTSIQSSNFISDDEIYWEADSEEAIYEATF